jgi:RNA polymerase sigma-70 factor, ECF subfamily
MTDLTFDDLRTAPTDRPIDTATSTDDAALVSRCRAGDKNAFEILVKRYEKKVFWIAYNLTGSSEDARDLGQEAFLRAYRSLDRFDERYGFYTWLYRITVNLSIDFLRKKGKGETVSLEEFPTDPAGDSPPETNLEAEEVGARIKRTLAALPAKYRAVIVLRDVEELSCEEIARIIGCTNATTRWRLHKARELFRERWAKFGYDAP